MIPTVVIAVAIGGLGPLLGPPVLTAIQVYRAQIRLLCETDHQALLDACRGLSRQLTNAEFKGKVYKGAEVRGLPEPIPTLRPSYVTIGRDGLVVIGMDKGWYDLGIWAFPEGYEKPPIGYGDRELLEGLWYYDKGYRTDPEVYDKTITRLLSRNKNASGTTSGPAPNSDHIREQSPQP